MCGLWAYFLRSGRLFDEKAYVMHDPWKHASANRGPDKYVELCGSDYHMCFHRLAIHDMSIEGDQPFFFEWEDGTTVHLMCNGEIYNYEALVEEHHLQSSLESKSDCEVIVHLLRKMNYDVVAVCKLLQGEFAFVARVEHPSGHVHIYAARDTFGVRPLYIGDTMKGVIFSSMLAGIAGIDPMAKGRHFIPGYTYSECQTDHSSPVWTPFADVLPVTPHTDTQRMQNQKQDMYQKITASLIEAVRTRLSSEREIGFLLSGGLDSSLVVAIAAKILGVQRPKTFSIGFEKDAPDLVHAREVAAFLNTDHTEVIVSTEEAIKEVPFVIKAIETYDITTVRASTPQYMLARYISENTNVKVIMNGDGSDEVACGYLYNYFAPSAKHAHRDATRLLSEIHYYDGLRVDRTLGAHGLEARVPFLDPAYVQTYMSTPCEWRRPSKDPQSQRMEKQLLREAFAHVYPNILPENVLWRQKEAFSDAVSMKSKSWYKVLQDHIEPMISDTDYSVFRMKYEYLPPVSKESYYYRKRFEELFGHTCEEVVPHFWLPQWCAATTEPSARALAI
jgi:asparagine synthase (glutamine-hydrolysing)